jgi:hypothetical protein
MMTGANIIKTRLRTQPPYVAGYHLVIAVPKSGFAGRLRA